MKVIAGKHKGRNIAPPANKDVRPTTGMAREAIFNLLQHGKFMKAPDFVQDENPSVLEGRRVVDIFCGTGAMGIEALSRGAGHVVFIDQNPRVMDLLEATIKHIGEGPNTAFIRSDSTRLPKARNTCMLAFVDPPYNKGLALPALKSLANQGWLGHGAVVVVETSRKEDINLPEKYFLVDERDYNNTRIRVLQYRNPEISA
ncbi:MAG: methyltransferase domain-containing protein [Proteobacteria bacterium]|nr:methyltransferase domain-containing protein [Pseudomonadota bacterium]